MPGIGLAAIAQGLLTKWEAAQAARYNAWSGASSVPAGLAAVVGTAGSMVKGVAGDTRYAAAAGRYIATPVMDTGITFRDTALRVLEPIRSRLAGGGTAHQSYGTGLAFK